MELTKQRLREIIKEEIQNEENESEGRMARSDLFRIAKYAQSVHDMLSDQDDLPEWLEAKITKAADYLASVKHYIEYEVVKGDK
jgi:hypothetical protein